MEILRWSSDINADGKRSLELNELRMKLGGLYLAVEEEFGKRWSLDFNPVQAWKVTAEECAASITSKLPRDGGLFVVNESEWKNELGRSRLLEPSQHFVVCCYDEIIEVLAWKCEISPIATDDSYGH
jgi:hypothetical protein